jgi:ribulose-phosphate 3-epimerase
MGKLSASILAADLANLAQQVQLVSDHVDVIHVDVMDGHFARPLTMGPIVVASLRPHTTLPLHGHLMVEAPEALFDELAEAGMDLVSFHVEAAHDPGPVISKARGAGMGVGLAVSAETAIDAVVPHLDDVDGVTVTSVPPGSANRGFVQEVLPKVEAVRAELDRRGLTSDLEVEGGIEADDARRCLDAGANVVVAASAIFGTSDVGAAARELAAIVGPA